MKLSSYIDKKLVYVGIEAKNKYEVITKMVEMIAKADNISKNQKEQILTSILNREEEMSTVMGKGVAIPHAKVDNYDDIVLAIGILKDPIYCESALNIKEEIKVVFMIISGVAKTKIMLKLISTIMNLVSNSELLQFIKNESEKDNIVKKIKDSNIEVSENVIAEDVMEKNIEPILLTNTLHEVARKFILDNITGLPVVDENNQFIGEITERELIEYGMPKYASLMNDLAFLNIGEQTFELYFKNEHLITVKDLYRKNALTVDKNASIIEVCFLMITKGNTRVYVVENKKYIGMITRSDIIKKVLHI